MLSGFIFNKLRRVGFSFVFLRLLLLGLVSLITFNATAASPSVTILKAPTPPVIDGNLAEFGNAHDISMTAISGGNVGFYKFLWDSTALYIGASVIDASSAASITIRDGSISQEDSLEILVDTLHNHGIAEGSDDYRFLVNILNTQADAKAGSFSSNTSFVSAVKQDLVTYQGVLYSLGYNFELKIPWASMGMSAPATGSTLALDIILRDKDGSTIFPGTAWANATGGGIYDPDGWGHLVLSANVKSPSTFDFSLVNSGNRFIARGASAGNTLFTATSTILPLPPVSFSVSDLPSGFGAILSSVNCTPRCSTGLTLTAPLSTPLGTYRVTVTGTAGGITRTTAFGVSVTDPPPLLSMDYGALHNKYITQYAGQINSQSLSADASRHYYTSYFIHGMAAAVEASKDEQLLIKLMGYVDNMINTASDLNGDGHKEWQPLDSSNRPFVLYMFQGVGPIAKTAAVIMKNPAFKSKLELNSSSPF